MRFGTARYRHTTRIEDLAVSTDGTFAAANSRTLFHGGLRTYDLATGRVLLTIHDNDKHGEDVDTVAISPDGTTIATAMTFPSGHAVVFHEVSTGRETARLPLSAGSNLLLYMPDGKHLVVADGKTLQLIGLAKGEVVRTFPVAGSIFAAALSPDGKQLLVGGHDNGWFARRWELDTGRELEPLPLSHNGVRSVAYSPEGATVAVGGHSGRLVSVLLFDAATAKERMTVPFPDASYIRSLAFSPDGKTFAASGGSTVRLFDTTTGRGRLKIDAKAIGLRFAPDGATLVGAVGGTIYRWDTATGKPLIPEGGDSPVGQISVTADGKRVMTLGHEGDAHVWDARSGEHQRRLSINRQQGFAVSPDGRFLVWPVADEAIQFQTPGEPKSVYTGSRLRMLDLEAGTLVDRFGGFEGAPSDLSFIDGGKTLVTADRGRRDAGVRVWDVATGKVVRSFAAEWKPGSRVVRSRLSPDGKVLAILYRGQSRGLLIESEVKLWDVATGKELAGPRPAWFDPEVMAFAPDGTTMAVAIPADRLIQFRDTAMGQVRGELRGPFEKVTALAIGPDGRLLTGFSNGTLFAWDPRAVNPPP
jgi:WD40 repeat protein